MPDAIHLREYEYEQRNVNLRREVCDLIEGECVLRNNGGRGFSLTINQIILEYFELRTPKLDPSGVAPRPQPVEQP